MDYRENFATLLRTHRRSKNYTQMQLARKCGISDRQLIDIEQGKVNPKLDTIISLCRECDIDIGKLSDK